MMISRPAAAAGANMCKKVIGPPFFLQRAHMQLRGAPRALSWRQVCKRHAAGAKVTRKATQTKRNSSPRSRAKGRSRTREISTGVRELSSRSGGRQEAELLCLREELRAAHPREVLRGKRRGR